MKNKLIKLLGGYTEEELDDLVDFTIRWQRTLRKIKKDRLESAKGSRSRIIKRKEKIADHLMQIILKLPDYDTTFDGWRER